MKTYKYIVDEEKRTVVCLVYVKNDSSLNLEDGCVVFRGIAKCNVSDEFDEGKGKTIATKRALLELSKWELGMIEDEYPEWYAERISETYAEMTDAMNRKSFLKQNISALRKELDEIICPF